MQNLMLDLISKKQMLKYESATPSTPEHNTVGNRNSKIINRLETSKECCASVCAKSL